MTLDLLQTPEMRLRIDTEVHRLETTRLLNNASLSSNVLASTAVLRGILDGLTFTPPGVRELVVDVDRLQSAYALLRDRPVEFSGVTPWLVSVPPVVAYTGLRVAGAAAGLPAAVLEQERDAPTEAVLQAWGDQLEARLAGVDPAFVGPYRGVLAALDHQGPDWVRQATASMRELMGALLTRCAPAAQLVAWSASPGKDEFDKGQWTRRAQLRYVFRAARTGGTTQTVDAIIDLILGAFSAQNVGVHTLAPPHTPEGMRLLVTNMQGHITSILDAAGL